MTEAYLEIFYEVCILFAPIVIPVLGVYLLFKFTSDLLFKG